MEKIKAYDSNDAVINGALGTVLRLNDVLNLAAESAMNCNAKQWYHCLTQLYREVVSKMSSEERNKIWIRMEKANEMVTLECGNPEANPGMMSNKLYMELHFIDCCLRISADKHNLLVPNKKTFMDAWNEQD